jgi:hypothetical protein
LPQFSVNGSDPLSAAIAAGSAQMEAPMAALPWIQANATTTAENIGVAGQRYRETDETLAQKAKEQQFPTDGSKPPQMGVDKPMQAFGPVKDSPARDPHPPAVPDQGLTVVPDDQVIRGNLDFDPTNSRIGDERYGHWENVPPFMGPRNGPPPPLTTEITKFPTDPASLAARTAPPTNFVTPGKSWIGETDPPFARYQEQYRIRISGTEATPYSRVVASDGKMQEQRWVQNTYEMQTNTRTVFGGPVEVGRVRDGDLGGLPAVLLNGRWQPASIADIARLSAANPGTTFYLPGDCGFSDMKSGVLTNGFSGKLPSPLVMTVPR